MNVKIEQSWKNALADEFGKPYFESLVRFLHKEKADGQVIYPPGSQIFRAFDLKMPIIFTGKRRALAQNGDCALLKRITDKIT